MDLDLKDKLILITGDVAGIGGAITRACLDEGARVVILSRISDDATSFMAEMRSAKAPCTLIKVHLEDAAQCKGAIEQIQHDHGDIYGLVNNTGINDSAGLEQGSVERFIESINKNLIHYYALAHYALSGLKRTRGTIVNIASIVGCAAIKRAQLALTREWAAELLPYNIRVNAVVPAEVTPDSEIAATTVFLLSPTQSAHTTGQHIIVDGGYVHLDRALT